MFRYCAYGLKLSADRPIPGLLALPDRTGDAVDVRLWLDSWPPSFSTPHFLDNKPLWYASRTATPADAPNLKVWRLQGGQVYWFRYRDGAEFLLQDQGRSIWARWYEPLTVEDAATYLLGPVLGFVLRWRGRVCLHASAVAVEGGAIAFIGRAGAGKSTTAAAFAQRGYAILTDDVAALSFDGQQFSVQPAYPGLRLWSSSVAALFGRSDALPRLVPTHPTWDKRYLDLSQPPYQFQQHPLPLRCLYLLGQRQSDSTSGQVIPVAARDGAIALIANTYTNYLLNKTMRAAEFNLLWQLLELVPVRQFHPHTNPDCLAEAIATLARDSQLEVTPVKGQ
jgi:hypothetical protein